MENSPEQTLKTKHEAWRKARALDFDQENRHFHDSDGVDVLEVFIAGMSREHEVAKLIGQIELLREIQPALKDGYVAHTFGIQAKLDALLEGKS